MPYFYHPWLGMVILYHLWWNGGMVYSCFTHITSIANTFQVVERVPIFWFPVQMWPLLCTLFPIGSMYGIYAIIGGILMVNVTIYSIHGSYGFTRCLGASKIFKLCLFNSKSVSSLVYSLGGSSDPPIPISNTSYSKRPPYSGRSQKSLRILLIVLLEYFKINRRGFPKIRIYLKNSQN